MDINKLVAAKICSHEQLPVYGNLIAKIAEQYEIDKTQQRLTMWLTQIAYESGGFTKFEENLGYSASRLLQIFPTHFTQDESKVYEHHPDKIGARVYANRYGNGDEASGEGYLFRGRGVIQITFKDNYRAYGNAIGLGGEVVANPHLLSEPDMAVESAGWYWHSRGCNELADANDFDGVTHKINGGFNGLAERKALFATVQLAFSN